jgi:hypothetical protein
MSDDLQDLSDGGSEWPLVKVFDVAAVVLAVVVVARAVGAILSAFEVPGPNVNFGAPTGAGVIHNLNLFEIPTYLRVQYGASWADLASGILLAASLSLLALPRMLWDVPAGEEWGGVAPKVLMSVLAVAFLATAASVVGIVNNIWQANQLSRSTTEALNIGGDVAAALLSGIVSVLCWFALPYVQEPDSTDQSILRSPSEPEETHPGDVG